MKRVISVVIVAVMSACVSASASAAFVVPDGNNYPWVRSATADSSYAEWDVFTSAAGPNTPDIGMFISPPAPPGALGFDFFDASGTGLLDSQGDIGSVGGVLMPRVTVPGTSFIMPGYTSIVLQVRFSGPGVLLPLNMQPHLIRSSDFQGQTTQRMEFRLPPNAFGHTINLGSSMPGQTIHRVAVDTYTQMPAPGAAGLLVCVGLSAFRRRRRSMTGAVNNQADEAT